MKEHHKVKPGMIKFMGNVSEVMSNSVVTIEVNETAASAARTMSERGFGCLFVTRNGSVVGILTERDLVRKVLARNCDANIVTVEEMMSHPLITVNPSMSVNDAGKLMGDKRIRRLAVMDSGVLVGIITTTDIARHIAKSDNFLDPLINALVRQEPTNSPYM